MEQTIGFIGAGNMASALIRGLIRAGVARPEQVIASEPSAERGAELEKELGISVVTDNLSVASRSDVVVLGVKPQVLPGILPNLRAAAREKSRLWVSIAAGTKSSTIEEGLGGGVRVVRVMPNTPALVGAGAAAISRGSVATDEDVSLTVQLFDAVGRTAVLDEGHLDAITGLSGSGPAFVMLIIEALSDGGVRAGLPRNVATTFAAQTVYGAAKLLLETGQHPGVLKDAVTSPGGTTITGLEELERHAVRGALISAVHAATKRSKELGG
jgi:pyrroline-5-carboxylate reductase